jgi:hypothetical protein
MQQQEVIDLILNKYDPNFRFIKTLNNHYPTAHGSFVIPQRQYTVNDSWLLSGSSSMILITQAILIMLTDLLCRKQLPNLSMVEINNLAEAEDFINHTIVCEIKQVKFNQPILKIDADFSFTITLGNITEKPAKGLIFFDFVYTLCQGKSQGSWTIAYNKNKFANQ